MKIFPKQYYIIFGRLLILLFLALCLFDFGVQAVAADHSDESSALVIGSPDVEIAPSYDLQNDHEDYAVDYDEFDDDDDRGGFIKWPVKKYPRPQKSGYGWSD